MTEQRRSRCDIEREKLKPVRLKAAYLAGPGSALQQIFVERFHAPSCGGCHETKREMDRIGPDEVLRRIDEFAEAIHVNASKRNWLKVLNFIEYHAFGLKHYKDLIREAVELHRAEVAKKTSLPPGSRVVRV